MTGKPVSNDWKTGAKSFQWLENAAEKFPMIGKVAEKVSNDWKLYFGKIRGLFCRLGAETGLSREQRSIVALHSGRHVVFAPPGTGKTELLAHRLRRALEGGVKAESMACLTFTNRAARVMEERVGRQVSGLFVGNFHSYAARYLARVQPLGHRRPVVDECTALELMEDAVYEVVPGDEDAERRIREQVMQSAALYCQYVHSRRVRAPADVVQSYWELVVRAQEGDERIDPVLRQVETEYVRIKQQNGVVDFNELLLNCLAQLLYGETRPQYAWVQVDEAQDLNACQWAILEQVLAPDGHLVVFADKQQAIYAFMGASAGALQQAVAHMQVHELTRNYRSPDYLLRLFRTYAQRQLQAPIRMRSMVRRRKGKRDVCLLEMKTAKAERDYICGRIIPAIMREPEHHIAVLMRTNRGVSYMSERLSREVDHFVIGAVDVFQYAVTRDFMALLQVLDDPLRRLPWSRILRNYGGMASLRAARTLVNRIMAGGLLPQWMLEADDVEKMPPMQLVRCMQQGRVVVFDTETTGLNPSEDDIIQVAAVELIDGCPGRELVLLLQTERALGASVAVHGISAEQLAAQGMDRRDGLMRLVEFIGSAPVLAHNCRFDMRMLEGNLHRLGLPPVGAGVLRLCSLELARALYPDAPRYTLAALLAQFQLEGVNSHDALDDARATVSLARQLARCAEVRRDELAAMYQTAKPVFDRLRGGCYLRWDALRAQGWLPSTYDRLFDRFLELVPIVPYPAATIREVEKKLVRHMDYHVRGQTLWGLTGPHLSRYAMSRESDLIMDDDRVIVSTIHRAKGLEFDSVIIAQVHDGQFPSYASRTAEAVMEDARCLYVGMTRARKQLIVTYSLRRDDGRPQRRSRFLNGLDACFSFIRV